MHEVCLSRHNVACLSSGDGKYRGIVPPKPRSRPRLFAWAARCRGRLWGADFSHGARPDVD